MKSKLRTLILLLQLPTTSFQTISQLHIGLKGNLIINSFIKQLGQPRVVAMNFDCGVLMNT